MAIQHMDGFDWLQDNYVTESQLNRAKYYLTGSTNNNNDVLWVNDPATGRFGYGKAIQTYSSTFSQYAQYTRAIPNPSMELIIGASFYQDYFASDGGLWGSGLVFHNLNTGGIFVGVYAGPRGIIYVLDRNRALIAQSSPGVVQEQTWFNMQARCLVSDISGQVEVKINDRVVILATSVDTTSSEGAAVPINAYGFGINCYSNTGHRAWVDDMYCLDTAAGLVTNFIGNARVKSQLMVADGSTINSTIGGSTPALTHWQSVLNQSFDDTQYVYEPTVGQFDWYDVDANLNNGVIYALQARVVARQDDATQRSMVPRLLSSTAIASGTSWALNQTYTHYTDVFEADPDTGIAWLPAQANVNQAGFLVDS